MGSELQDLVEEILNDRKLDDISSSDMKVEEILNEDDCDDPIDNYSFKRNEFNYSRQTDRLVKYQKQRKVILKAKKVIKDYIKKTITLFVISISISLPLS